VQELLGIVPIAGDRPQVREEANLVTLVERVEGGQVAASNALEQGFVGVHVSTFETSNTGRGRRFGEERSQRLAVARASAHCTRIVPP
jgi:hypothetical protein